MTHGPLAGLRVVVTRPREQARTLVDALEERGATAMCVPVIEVIEPVDGGQALGAALESLTADDWLVLTSPNGAIRAAAVSTELSCRVAAIGPGTRARAEAAGLRVDLVPDRAIAEGLLEVFPDPPASGGRAVLARAEVAREVLPEGLAQRGWEVADVAAYRTVGVPVDDADAEVCRNADVVAFTSSSTVEHLVAAVSADGLPPAVASIGPATSSTAGRLGVTVDVEAAEHSIPGLVDALVGYYRGRILIHLEDAASADAQWCLEQYFADIDERFATGLDRGAVLTSDPHEVSPPNGLFLVARLDGRPVGCGCLKKVAPDVADIKRMWLDPEVRGRGLGRGLLDRLVEEGRALGLRRVQLETNEALTEAIGLYRSAGFVEVPAFNDEPHAHHWFALDLG